MRPTLRLLLSLALFSLPVKALAAPACAETALGRICLEHPAQRVVALDQQSTEFLLALGLQPIGVTGPETYRKQTGDEEPRLGADVADLGLSSAPNAELILTLAPDLIVGTVANVQKSLPLLGSIAPAAAFLTHPAGRPGQIATMTETLTAIAALTGRQAQADAFLAAFEADLSDARARFDKAGLGRRPVVLGNVNAGVTGAEIMLFNANALPAEVLARAGFTYVQNDPRFLDKGFTVTTAEGLIAFEDADFLYMPFNPQGVEKLMQTPVWRNLRFVREGRVRAVPYRFIHNGPLSARLFLRDVQKALLP